MDEKAYWIDDGTAGPPTAEDDAWFTHAVVSLDYPRAKRDPEPMEGQMSIGDIQFEETTYDLYFDHPGIWQVGTIGNTEMVTIPHPGLWEVRPGQEPRFIRP